MNFDLSNIKYSINDIKRKVTLPEKPNLKLAEFIGIVTGDGYLYNNFNKYIIGIVGNPKNDGEYFSYIKKLIYVLFNIQTKINIYGRGLRIIFNSKAVFSFFVDIINMPYGRGKGQKVEIPEFIYTNAVLSNAFLRGLYDADGSIFTSNKKGSLNYPSIELTTTSIKLARQVRNLLNEKEFRVTKIRSYKSKLLTYKISLYGISNTLKWFNQISFSNSNKLEKLIGIIKRSGSAGI